MADGNGTRHPRAVRRPSVVVPSGVVGSDPGAGSAANFHPGQGKNAIGRPHFPGPKTQGDFPIILFAVARTQAAGNHIFRGFYVSREY